MWDRRQETGTLSKKRIEKNRKTFDGAVPLKFSGVVSGLLICSLVDCANHSFFCWKKRANSSLALFKRVNHSFCQERGDWIALFALLIKSDKSDWLASLFLKEK